MTDRSTIRLVDEFAFRQLERQVSDVAAEQESNHTEVTRSIEELERQARDVREGLADLEDRHDANSRETAQAVGDLDQRLTRVETSLARAVRQVAWLQEHAALQAGAAVADLDSVSPEVRERAQRTARARAARAALIPDLEKEILRTAAGRFDQWQLEATAARDDLVAAGAAFADASESEAREAQKAASERYRMADEKMRGLTATGAGIRERAADARRRLAAAAALEASSADVIRAGDEAWQRVHTELAESIVTMLQEHALPPMWFSLTFGLRPPASDIATWLKLATEVLAYRVSYGVTHKVLALGPDHVESTDQQRWRHEIEAKLAEI